MLFFAFKCGYSSRDNNGIERIVCEFLRLFFSSGNRNYAVIIPILSVVILSERRESKNLFPPFPQGTFAGTFDCIVVREHKLEKAPLMKRDRITLTWYALGYGMVRHDTFFINGDVETTEQLESII